MSQFFCAKCEQEYDPEIRRGCPNCGSKMLRFVMRARPETAAGMMAEATQGELTPRGGGKARPLTSTVRIEE